MANLSPHFTLEELTASQTANRLGFSNIPADGHLPNLIRLCTVLLEPVRELVGQPVKVNSGYRCPQLNAAVGGVVKSAHMDGRAADIVVPGMDLSQVWALLNDTKLPHDQMIWETNSIGSQWIHLAIAADGAEPRKQVLKLKQPFRRHLG